MKNLKFSNIFRVCQFFERRNLNSSKENAMTKCGMISIMTTWQKFEKKLRRTFIPLFIEFLLFRIQLFVLYDCCRLCIGTIKTHKRFWYASECVKEHVTLDFVIHHSKKV